MEPPKFRHKKVPRGTGSPPVPVMHSPPRPVTVKDQQVGYPAPDAVPQRVHSCAYSSHTTQAEGTRLWGSRSQPEV